MADDRLLLAIVKPTVPFSQMTEEQLDQFAAEVAGEMKRRYAIARDAADSAEAEHDEQ
jgi:hypothetical protein